MNHILIGAAALAVVALVEGLYWAFVFVSQRRREALQRRLQPLSGGNGKQLSLLRAGRLAASPFLAEVLGGMPFLPAMAELLDQAQVGGTVAKQLLLSAVLAATGIILGLVMKSPVMGALLAIVGVTFPTLRLLMARARRSRQISEQLPNALDMMARSLRAGHALTSAFKLVATEMPSPINVEFARAYEQQNLGSTFDRTVQEMTSRVPNNRDLKIFAVSVIVQKETGGNLVEILEKLGQTIRVRYQFYGRLAALTGESKASAIVLGGLPLAMALLLGFVNPTYLTPLGTSAMGRSILLYIVGSWSVGLLWMRQMGKVEF